jgi:hypothetical protein
MAITYIQQQALLLFLLYSAGYNQININKILAGDEIRHERERSRRFI